jgi:hypothetical protein
LFRRGKGGAIIFRISLRKVCVKNRHKYFNIKICIKISKSNKGYF